MPDGVKPELDEGNQSSPSDDGDLEVGEDDYINAMDTACCECDDGGDFQNQNSDATAWSPPMIFQKP